MKNKTSLLLMEQLVMILVFALAAARCLQAFAQAKVISEETASYDQSVTLARNAADLLKATGGDLQTVQALEERGFSLSVTRQDSLPGLAMGEIQVFFENTLLFSLETGWQEALP